MSPAALAAITHNTGWRSFIFNCDINGNRWGTLGHLELLPCFRQELLKVNYDAAVELSMS